jgi:Transposase DDE domain/Transposase DNA-binding
MSLLPIQTSDASVYKMRYAPLFFKDLQFKDLRLSHRFQQIISTLQREPSKSFPQLFAERKGLEGFYRFVHHPEVEEKSMIQAARKATLSSLIPGEVTLALHDTTEFDFSHASEVDGLGRISGKKRGFLGHFCLGVRENREILGVLGLQSWTRTGKKITTQGSTRYQESNKESSRWKDLIEEVNSAFPENSSVIHVADREADDYVCLSRLIQKKIRFVFRCQFNRKIQDPEFKKLFDSLEKAQVVCEREVHLSRRKDGGYVQNKKSHPIRSQRKARLEISSKKLKICRHLYVDRAAPETLELNFVRVFESNPPEGEPPVEWILITTESIETPADLLKIVDIYRTRWVIEEYFKALKTGCSFEKRGLETFSALQKCLVLLAPIAAHLYNLKYLGRNYPEQSASSVVTPIQLQILAHKTKKSESQLTTVGSVMLAIAQLGGHLSHNGLPGWQVLGRGYEKLLSWEEGYLLFQGFSQESQRPNRIELQSLN